MLKNLSLSNYKKIRLFSSLLVLITFLVLSFFSEGTASMVINVFVHITLIIHSLCSTIILVIHSSSKRKRIFEDELSRLNEGKAADLSIHTALVVIMLISFIKSIAGLEIAFNTNFAFCTYVGLLAIYDIFYLIIDRRGLKDAGTDNED